MTKAALRLLTTLCALALATALVAGCGGVPGNAVAEVDGTSIAKTDFDHWVNVIAKGGQTPGPVPDPPDFEKCVAEARKTVPKPAQGQAKISDADLKKQCKTRNDELRKTTVDLLVTYQWIEGEAAEQGVKVTDAEVKKSFEEQKKANFPKEAEYKKFLEQSGQTEEDILRRVKVELLGGKIRDKVVKGKDKVSDAQIKAYYDKNKQQFAQPETRDLRVVLTKTEAKANEALAALKSGQQWGAVVKQYSIDETSKAQGGKLPNQVKGAQEKNLDAAAFDAPKGKLSGPVKTQFGWYVFEVTKITPAKQQSLDEAKETIKATLATQNQQKALDDFLKGYNERWRAKTECREGYTTTQCKNGPKPTPTPTPGAAQQPGQ
jgi:foldase protein PrsA